MNKHQRQDIRVNVTTAELKILVNAIHKCLTDSQPAQ